MTEAGGLRRLLDDGARVLGAAGIADPRRESAALLASLTDRAPLELLLGLGEPPPLEQRDRFGELVRRRARHEPLQILIGRVGFHDIELETAPGVFVPRPETELLVERLCAHVAATGGERPRVLDVGTGSGAIAVAALARLRHAVGLGIDRCPRALALTRRNAIASGVSDRLALLRSDLLDALAPAARFDVVASNPPYIASAAVEELAPEVRDHDPRLALDGGRDGLDAYRRLAAQLPARLLPGGLAIFEIGADQGHPVQRLLASRGLGEVQVHEDLAGHSRIVIARAC